MMADDHSEEKVAIRGQVFPKETTKVLESLYVRGMNGWGKSHALQLEEATTATGLDLGQVKVYVTKYLRRL